MDVFVTLLDSGADYRDLYERQMSVTDWLILALVASVGANVVFLLILLGR